MKTKDEFRRIRLLKEGHALLDQLEIEFKKWFDAIEAKRNKAA